MVTIRICKSIHPRRRGFVIRSAIIAATLVVVFLWFNFKGRRVPDDNVNNNSNNVDEVLLVKDSIRADVEDRKKQARLSNNAQHEHIDGAIMLPPLKATIKADDSFAKAHHVFPDVDKQIPLPNSRTTEEKLYDEEIEKMNKKIVPRLGEGGSPVQLEGAEKELADALMKKEAFNIVASDKISYTRSVPDNRNEKCKEIRYPDDLPDTSVIIIFTNEAWSPLLRTIYSVINRTPDYLLHEIILLDDYSDRVEVKGRLDRYIQLNFSKKVKIIRAPERLGLIRARLAGARAATGQTLVFLDSHCEVNIGWLEPLLARIKENPKVALVPIIEVIDDDSMHYYSSNSEFFQVGSFTWSGHFTWVNVPDREIERRGNSLAPTRSPTMAGGLFAMERNYFWEMGGYDEGMDVWGGENLEMSFRVWMCGGSLETIPCSRVGHIFRSFHPYTFPGDKDTHGINTVRMAEVWMDDYKRLFYLYRPDLQVVDYGNVNDRKLLRKTLRCNDFKWYLDNIVPEKFILDDDSLAYGRVANRGNDLCLDMLQQPEKLNYKLGLYGCHSTTFVSQVRNGQDLCLDFLQKDEEKDYTLGVYFCHTTPAMSQYFSFSKKNKLRRESMCARAGKSTFHSEEVIMTTCFEDDPEQQWKLSVNGPIQHVESKRCLDSFNSTALKSVWVTPCDGSPTQKWKFDSYVAAIQVMKQL